MINRNITDKILTIGPEYRPVEGGISQVLDTYDKEVLSTMRFISETTKGGKIKKGLKCVSACIAEWYTLLLNKNIRIVHLHTCSNISFKRSSLFVRIAKMMNRKIVLHMHGGGFRDYYLRQPEFVKKICSKADAIIALTPKWEKFFKEEVGLENVFIVNNIIRQPDTISSLPSNPTQMVFLGVITKNKGIFDVIEAIADIKNDLRGRFKFIIGGLGDEATLTSLINSLGVEEIVEYRGWIDARDKASLFIESTAFVLCSYYEGLPISILEAMSYGLPIICSDVGGIPEIVNSSNGIMVNAGDKDAIKNAILRLVNNPDEVKTLGRNSLDNIAEYYPDKVAQQLENLYSELLS